MFTKEEFLGKIAKVDGSADNSELMELSQFYDDIMELFKAKDNEILVKKEQLAKLALRVTEPVKQQTKSEEELENEYADEVFNRIAEQ